MVAVGNPKGLVAPDFRRKKEAGLGGHFATARCARTRRDGLNNKKAYRWESFSGVSGIFYDIAFLSKKKTYFMFGARLTKHE